MSLLTQNVKQLVNNLRNFSFQPVSMHTAKEAIEGFRSNKANAGEFLSKF